MSKSQPMSRPKPHCSLLLYLYPSLTLLIVSTLWWPTCKSTILSHSLPSGSKETILPEIRNTAPLQWTPCPDMSSFRCSFFTVPLDYSNPTAEDSSVIAIRMLPATVPDSERLGTIFTNPGGPGTSGHSFLVRSGPALSVIFEGKYDIISWDPRGVNMSTARISCHSTNLERQLFSLSHTNGDLNHRDLSISGANTTLLIASAHAELLADVCRDALGDKVIRSVTTVNVARDLEEMRKAVGEGGLRYWGFSYGTTLGATYAAMFPEQAERLILDGVVFAPEQYTSFLAHGISSGDATSEVFNGFISRCVSAGPSRCALAKNNTSSSQLAQHFWDLADRLDVFPVPVVHPKSTAVPSILQRSDLLLATFAAMLRPASWAALAQAIFNLDSGDGRALAALSGAGGTTWDLKNLTDGQRAEAAGWDTGREMGENEADMAVSCGDGPPFSEGFDASWTKEWLDWKEQLVSLNPLSGAIWFKKMVRCRQWGRIQPPPERYQGSWKMGEDLKPPKYPILFVSNAHDPVSPISSGRQMVDLFGKENARLLENNAYGHASTSEPSLCIAKAVREYMINGTLPIEGTICEPEEGIIFPATTNARDIGGKYTQGDNMIVQALIELSNAVDGR
ncbi:Alpha/Beta hydrolase protein [Mycena rebaudengoi]|nr:Alpha/Beta hydrolase protein [Mycena rebaudengoi]